MATRGSLPSQSFLTFCFFIYQKYNSFFIPPPLLPPRPHMQNYLHHFQFEIWDGKGNQTPPMVGHDTNTRLIAATQNPQNNNQLMNQSYHDKNAAGKFSLPPHVQLIPSILVSATTPEIVFRVFCLLACFLIYKQTSLAKDEWMRNDSYF